MDTTEEREENSLPAEPKEEKITAPQKLEVDLSEDEDDDEGTEVAAKPEDKKSRRQNYRKLRESLEAERTERQKERERFEREMAELRGRVEGMRTMPQQPQTPAADPVDAEIEAIENQQSLILARIRSGANEQEVESLTKEYKSLNRKLRKLEIKQAIPDVLPQRDRVQDDNERLAEEFPQIYSDPVLRAEAAAELAKLAHRNKEPVNLATARKAAKAVMDRYQRKPAPPSEADKARHTSVPGRAGVNGGPQRFSPSALQLASARAFTSHIDGWTDEQRVKYWAQKVGKKRGLIA